MKKLFKISYLTACLFAVVSLLSCKNPSSANDGIKVEIPEHYQVPKELKYTLFDDPMSYIVDRLYPIGWSKDGRYLAYATEPADEAVGAYFFEIHIKDFSTNSDAWMWKPEEDPETGSIATTWNENQELFDSKLKEYGIIPQEFQLDGFDTPFIGKNTRVWIDTTMRYSDFLCQDVVNNVTIKCGTLEDNRTLLEYAHSNEYDLILYEGLGGLIKCPYKDMAAVVGVTMRRGYEGPPHVISFYFTKVEK